MRLGCSEALGVWLFPLGSWFPNARVLLINGGYLRESSSAVDTFRAICESEDAAINAHISK